VPPYHIDVSTVEIGSEGYNYIHYVVPGFADYMFVSDTPEPGSLYLLGGALLVGLGVLRLRRK
jgi:hypothetical protein